MRYLKIELLRTWRSFTMFLPVVILLAATLAFLLQHGAAADGLAPLHFYSVGLLMPLALLTPVVTQLREQRLRAGGTLWRPQNLWATHAARLAVATGYAGIGHLLALGLVRAFSPAFFLVETLVFAGGYAMGLLLWSLLRTASVVLAPLAGIAAVILGLVGVDTDQWYRNPLCWHLRPTLPIVGVEANSTLAAPDSPIHDISPVWPTLAHLGLGAGCFVAAMALAAHPLASPHSSRTIHDVTLSGPARLSTPRALALALPWRIWAALTVLMWAILAVARARYGVATGAALYGLAAVPLTATIVGVTAWTAHKDAWPDAAPPCRTFPLRRAGDHHVCEHRRPRHRWGVGRCHALPAHSHPRTRRSLRHRHRLVHAGVPRSSVERVFPRADLGHCCGWQRAIHAPVVVAHWAVGLGVGGP